MQTDVMFSSGNTEWETPQELFDRMNRFFGFTLDVCATKENAKCERYFTKEDDGLSQSWIGNRCWMNPPYGREVAHWVQKAVTESLNCTLVLGLLPARTDTAWWQDYVLPYADVHFIRGRLKFGNCENSAPFPSALVLWWPKI